MKSGIEAINEGFLDSLTHLTSVFEMFRNCSNLGYQWCNKYGLPQDDENWKVELTPFIPTSLFWNCPDINNFTGVFNYIANGIFGNYWSGYNFMAKLPRDLFKYNTANNIILDYAFNKWNRAICESDLFGHIKDRIISMEGIFFGWNLQDYHRWADVADLPENWVIDLAQIFPDNTYPGITNIVGAFEVDNSNDNAGTDLGFNADKVMTWTTSYGDGRSVQLDAKAFLDKFPNANADRQYSPFPSPKGNAYALGGFGARSINWAQAQSAYPDATTFQDIN
jgi:hypothetical protein